MMLESLVHLLHPLADRPLCLPDSADRASCQNATHEPELATCQECLTFHEQQVALRSSLGLTPERHRELREKASIAVAEDHNDEPLNLTPIEVLEILETIEDLAGKARKKDSGEKHSQTQTATTVDSKWAPPKPIILSPKEQTLRLFDAFLNVFTDHPELLTVELLRELTVKIAAKFTEVRNDELASFEDSQMNNTLGTPGYPAQVKDEEVTS